MFPSGWRSPEAILTPRMTTKPRSACRRGPIYDREGPSAGRSPRGAPGRVVPVLLVFLGLGGWLGGTGCAARGGAAPERRALYLTEHPEVDGGYAEAIMAGQVMIGMSPEMVSAAWGKPQRAERRTPPREATAEQSVPNTRVEPEEVNRIWNVRYVYGNYLVNVKVANLFFVADRLKLIEYVDTKGQNSISVSDPGARIPPQGGYDPSAGPAKGGGH